MSGTHKFQSKNHSGNFFSRYFTFVSKTTIFMLQNLCSCHRDPSWKAVYSISRLLTKVKKRAIKKVGGGNFGISKSEIKVVRCRTA